VGRPEIVSPGQLGASLYRSDDPIRLPRSKGRPWSTRPPAPGRGIEGHCVTRPPGPLDRRWTGRADGPWSCPGGFRSVGWRPEVRSRRGRRLVGGGASPAPAGSSRSCARRSRFRMRWSAAAHGVRPSSRGLWTTTRRGSPPRSPRLAAAGISIFAVPTYEADFVLVRKARVEVACPVLRVDGHQVLD
jgi:hypothetical protein